MGKIGTYFNPKRKLHRVPSHITAAYNRAEMSREQALIIMAGKARDPHAAQKQLGTLQDAHGGRWWLRLRLAILRAWDKSFNERLLILFRRAFGEGDRPTPRTRTPRSNPALVEYRFRR